MKSWLGEEADQQDAWLLRHFVIQQCIEMDSSESMHLKLRLHELADS